MSPHIVFTDISDVTPERLTSILHHTVTDIQIRDNPAFNSQVYHLSLTYSPEPPDSIPRHLLLKLNGRHHGKLEIDFYQRAQSLPSGTLPIPLCLQAAYDSVSGNSHLILEDLSDTHITPVTRQQLLTGNGVPTAVQRHQIIDSLAKFHAHWWQHHKLGTENSLFAIRPWYSDKSYFLIHIKRRQREWAKFSSTVSKESVNSQIFDLFPRVIDQMSTLWSRYLEPRLSLPHQLTLSHGDCYLTQMLCPLKHTSQTAILVDFDSVSANFASYDLVYLIATFWTPAQRHQHEVNILRQYHQSVQAYGVKNYSWDQLRQDYRLMILFMIFDPIWDQTNGSSPAYWQPKLYCLTEAFKDLKCNEFLVAGGT